MVKTEPKYCRDCRKIRMCQKPGGEEIFVIIMIAAGLFFTYLLWNVFGFITLAIFAVATGFYLIMAKNRTWTCNSCAGKDIDPTYRPKPKHENDDEDEEEERPRKKRKTSGSRQSDSE